MAPPARTAAGLVALFVAAAVAFVVTNNARQAEARRELLSLVATITSVPTYCKDDRKPHYVTIRNLASRTATAASFRFHQDPPDPGTLPSDIPLVSLRVPLPAGQAVSECHALNRMKLFAHGIDPRSVRFIPMVIPDSVVFAP